MAGTLLPKLVIFLKSVKSVDTHPRLLIKTSRPHLGLPDQETFVVLRALRAFVLNVPSTANHPSTKKSVPVCVCLWLIICVNHGLWPCDPKSFERCVVYFGLSGA
jgi:hypothetical protein